MAQPATTPVLLIVLDGWGHSETTEHNAIHAAKTPTWDRLCTDHPNTLLHASGTHVGLPDEQMGNSEVGHMHLGAGRRVAQDLTRIDNAIINRSFFNNSVLKDAMQFAATNERSVHIMALVSPGGVHSHEDHIAAVIDLAAGCGANKLLLHCFLDGRDTPPKSAAPSLTRMQKHLEKLNGARIGSIIGRYYAMDRNKNWERTKIAYDLLVQGHSVHQATDANEALAMAYARQESDEFVSATAVGPRQPMVDGDVVIYMNFRADRARQLTRALTQTDFQEFTRERLPVFGHCVTLTEYSSDFSVPVAYPTENLKNTVGEYVSEAGFKQLRIAETEKYAHVTFFFNGGEERVFAGEDRILIPSPAVATYDLQPEMSAIELTDALVDAIQSRKYDMIVCNFANPDMVGHTGVFTAAVTAVQTVDHCLSRIETVATEVGMEILITADHGNVEKMRSDGGPSGQGDNIHTAHTSNLVPLIYVGRTGQLASSGTLADISPTLLMIMGLSQPAEMTGRPLLQLSGDRGPRGVTSRQPVSAP